MRMSIHVVYLVHISVEFTFIAMDCFIITMNRTPSPTKIGFTYLELQYMTDLIYELVKIHTHFWHRKKSHIYFL